MKRNTHSVEPGPQAKRDERGAAMVVSVIGMLALILATGLAVDISHFYTAKAELQNVADAAALAAAGQLNSTTGGVKMAVAEGTKALNKYDFKKSVTLTSANFSFATNLNGTYVDYASAQTSPDTIRFVKVVVPPQPVGVSFSKIVIGSTKNIGATATGGMSVGLTMNKFYTAFTFVETAASPLARGSSYNLVPKAGNDSAPGSYRVLTLGDGSAGSPLVLTGPIHAYGYSQGGYKAADLPAKSPAGNLTAPSMCRSAQIGINTRFGDYNVHGSTNVDDQPPDLIVQENINFNQYNDMLADPSVTKTTGGMKNRRVMTLPITRQPNYNTSTRNVIADRLGAFFIKKKIGTNCELEVEYIGEMMTVPMGTYSPGDPQSHELTVPVLYK